MSKKLLILLVLLISLISTSVFLKQLNGKEQEIDTDVKSGVTDPCIQLQESAKEQLSSLSVPRKWYVKSPYTDINSIDMEILLPQEEVSVTYDLNGVLTDAVYENEKWNINIPIESLEDGEYKLLVKSTACEATLSKSFSFNVSHPVYVTWTIDWEGFDVKEEYLKEMSRISSTYSVPMTHFFNPYIYIYLSKNRAEYLTDWVKSREGESIGLHLHMYNELVEASGVTVNNDPAWGSPTGKGHDTPNSNYGYDDYRKIIQWSLNQYEKNGLEQPTMYRAGGWYIDEENILVLKNLGFRIESSGRTYYIHGSNQLVGHWNLKDTTQPYQMNDKDQNITNKPNINIWQYPNNGGDSWAYTSEKLISKFKSNYNGGIAKKDTVVTFLSHPHWFDKEGPNIQGALKYVSQYSYDTDNGPVIFLTLDKVHKYTVKLK